MEILNATTAVRLKAESLIHINPDVNSGIIPPIFPPAGQWIKKTDKHTIEIIHTTTAARLNSSSRKLRCEFTEKIFFCYPMLCRINFVIFLGEAICFFNIFPNKTYGKLVCVLAHRSRKILGAFSCVPVHNRTPREKHLGSKRRPILGSVFGFINEKIKRQRKNTIN